jgi:hypothetical protein
MKGWPTGSGYLAASPSYAFNPYLVRDVLIDSGTYHARRRMVRKPSGPGGDRARAHPRSTRTIMVSDKVRETLLIPFGIRGTAAAAHDPTLIA